jgi:hypothetical protein
MSADGVPFDWNPGDCFPMNVGMQVERKSHDGLGVDVNICFHTDAVACEFRRRHRSDVIYP